MPLSTFDLLQHIQTAGILHANCAKKPENVTRIWDGKTPFIVHPIWCAVTLATEQLLSEEVRRRGILALLYHDVLEDTSGNLPPNLPIETINAIRCMTYRYGHHSEWENIKVYSPEIRLYSLYDKTSSLLDPLELRAYDLDSQQRKVRLLAEDVRENFGELNIVKIAYSLIPKESF